MKRALGREVPRIQIPPVSVLRRVGVALLLLASQLASSSTAAADVSGTYDFHVNQYGSTCAASNFEDVFRGTITQDLEGRLTLQWGTNTVYGEIDGTQFKVYPIRVPDDVGYYWFTFNGWVQPANGGPSLTGSIGWVWTKLPKGCSGSASFSAIPAAEPGASLLSLLALLTLAFIRLWDGRRRALRPEPCPEPERGRA